ncbi:pepsin/retropepsin-like aspartic protease family protein [Flammeovirga aprica]|uniref:Aspartyl protease n=1 Tax=Flammeovirga aprica JL-4 TaxID=694437 RepID=A0A7X9P1Y5_9BACT|nr:pepsin/retropepsin-like aspartic protease family protein [Flammeovirga aprica]NME68061.1 hypothetical protein [Flammeovirga aprica JL-4]
MKHTSYLFLALLFSCSITKYQKKGEVNPVSFHEKLSFTTVKNLILLPVEIDGQPKNMLFDTGAQLNLIQRNSPQGKTSNVGGASNQKAKLGSEITESIKIGEVEFNQTAAWNGDLKGLKEQISDFGGIIGQSIINKANWKIDYPNQQIELASKGFSVEGFQKIEIIREEGIPYVMLNIEGKEYKAVIDLGSSSNGINIPTNHPLADQLLNQYEFKENEREIYTIGGSQNITEQIGIIPSVKVGEIVFNEVAVDIRKSSQLRVGMYFFKDKVLIIDHITRGYFISE